MTALAGCCAQLQVLESRPCLLPTAQERIARLQEERLAMDAAEAEQAAAEPQVHLHLDHVSISREI